MTTPTRRSSISTERKVLAYIVGIFIIGVGHMIVGRIARGVLFFFLSFAIAIGFTYWLGWIGIVFYFAFLAYTLYDLHRVIRQREEIGK
jgi:TM2 domain-containing membrane protein YozV